MPIKLMAAATRRMASTQNTHRKFRLTMLMSIARVRARLLDLVQAIASGIALEDAVRGLASSRVPLDDRHRRVGSELPAYLELGPEVLNLLLQQLALVRDGLLG